MKQIIKHFVLIVIVATSMSSCVYSLFPIFTEDSLIYIPNLDGKWVQPNNAKNFILIESIFSIEDKTIPIKNKGETFIYNDFAVINGDTIRDKAFIEKYKKENMNIRGLIKEVQKGVLLSQLPHGSISDKTYWLKVSHEGEVTSFRMHLAQIGDNIFMDLFPVKYGESIKKGAAMVWLPVHTFMKFELNKDMIEITQFDLDKMKDLFNRNLIRMRHENIEGTILLTASSNEIQKFLKRYASDESVFGETFNYIKLNEKD